MGNRELGIEDRAGNTCGRWLYWYGYQRSLLAYERATYNFLNVTHPTENKQDFHA
jgi:hypothetical protein